MTKVYALPLSGKIAERHRLDPKNSRYADVIYVPGGRTGIYRVGAGLAWEVWMQGTLVRRTLVLRDALRTLDLAEAEKIA